MINRSTEEINDEETIVAITDNYSIKVPYRFIDCITKEILFIPVIASDTRTYGALALLNHFQQNKDGSPLYGNQVKLNKKSIIFNLDLYNEIRNFFIKILKQDHVILTDRQHDEALKMIRKWADGLTLNGQYIVELKKICIENDVSIDGLFVLPKQKNISKNSKQELKNVEVHEESVYNPPHSISSEIPISRDNLSILVSESVSPSMDNRSTSQILIMSGVVGNNIAYYIMDAISPSFVSDSFSFLFPAMTLVGMVTANVASCYIQSDINVGLKLGLCFYSSALNSLINLGIAVISGLPTWSSPLIAMPIIATATFGFPKLIESAKKIPNYFSFWRQTPQTPISSIEVENENQVLLRPM